MNRDEAKRLVIDHWQSIATKRCGYDLQIDDNLTEESTWGWAFSFLPLDPTHGRKEEAYAIDRLTGASIPVGTKFEFRTCW